MNINQNIHLLTKGWMGCWFSVGVNPSKHQQQQANRGGYVLSIEDPKTPPLLKYYIVLIYPFTVAVC